MSRRKRCYPSPKAARRACSKLGARVRVYWCRRCAAFHLANADKAPRFDPPEEAGTEAGGTT